MTFPKGYNAPSLKQENLIIKRVVPENYEFGRIEIESPSGNPIRVYDLERTLCDILRGSGSDVQIVGEAMKRYAASKDKNIHKLMQYADQLRVKPKVLRYMEVLLWLQKIRCNWKPLSKTKRQRSISRRSSSCRTICSNGCWNGFRSRPIRTISFSKADSWFPPLWGWTHGQQWIWTQRSRASPWRMKQSAKSLQRFALSRLPTTCSLRSSVSLTFGKPTITPASGSRWKRTIRRSAYRWRWMSPRATW